MTPIASELDRLVACLDVKSDACLARHGDRTVRPVVAKQKIVPFLQQLGIARIGDVTGLDRIGIPVVIAVRPNSRSLSVSQGKGLTQDSAWLSATMEAVELAVAEQVRDDLWLATLTEASATATGTINLALSTRCRSELLCGDDPLHWTQGYDLCSGKLVYVPWSLVGVDYRVDPPAYHQAFQVSTDGLASGSTYCEAIFHGLCELIERDASALMEFRSAADVQMRRYPIGADDGTFAVDLARRVEVAGCTLAVIDMTTDVGIPAFTAVISDGGSDSGADIARFAHSGGCGCHPSREAALVQAIVEAAQSRLARITGSRDDMAPTIYQIAEDTDRSEIVALFAALAGAAPPARSVASLDMVDSIPRRIGILLDRLKAVGIDQVVAVPLINDTGMAVARVIIPGLQTEMVDGDGAMGARAFSVLLQGLS